VDSKSRLDFDHARELLRVWVRPDEVAPDAGSGGQAVEQADGRPIDRAQGIEPDELPGRPLAPGLRLTLALETAGGIAPLPAELASDWARPIDELFEVAVANLRALGRPDGSLLQGSEIRALAGKSASVSSWLIALEEVFADMPENGGLVAVPESHMLLFLPIVDASVSTTIGPLIALIDRLYKRGPLPTSPNLYWWRPGNLILLPARVTEEGVEFSPPDELVEVVNALVAIQLKAEEQGES
jgi:hypothetical protein